MLDLQYFIFVVCVNQTAVIASFIDVNQAVTVPHIPSKKCSAKFFLNFFFQSTFHSGALQNRRKW